ncbi:PREDICTED: kinesin-like protein KIF19 isoform X2 [Amphimedon queenslandica]|uniref:Kinesin-like protein KIN-8B n=1 Tax=Amphimedon queenslandica TaxID=400682 RepID=A0A1X7V8D5_AMPQE|nr:PREDICTED: kinesin-like protein KIF19 isoform X2 [Amphimedon queenslandica]|eukprot:XP_019850423.1 PREDICTED: kinesin-like protein KIF19 isoform X2 [Amphimedon queenslandica]
MTYCTSEVALRVRPMNHEEFKMGAKVTARTVDSNLVVILDPTVDPDDILRANRSREKQYIFDYAFDQMATQDEVYEATMKRFVCDILSGFNVTVFAYGPTGAGKTYTMLGTPNSPGIMVLTLNDLFFKMKATENDVIYSVTMSYMEIYNEMIRDLLDPKRGILELREDVNGETVVAGLSEIEATSTVQVMDLLSKGNMCRTCEPTAANKTSSRSHAILKVVVRSRSRVMDVSQDIHIGCLFMVDLAGSERASVTKNRGKRMVEGAHINRSLLALGNVINALAAGHDKVSYVNFRDSKLTRILKDSLGGNAKTVMIAHISPASTSFEESRNTLKYAARSRNIKTKIHQNVLEVHYHVLQYNDIITQLKYKIATLQDKVKHCHCSRKPMVPHELKMLLSDHLEIQQSLSSINLHSLQNTIDAMKLSSVISEYDFSITLGRTSLDADAKFHCLCDGKDISQARVELATLNKKGMEMEGCKRELKKQLAVLDAQLVKFKENMKSMPVQYQQHLQYVLTGHHLQHLKLNHELDTELLSMKQVMYNDVIAELQRHSSSAFQLAERQSLLLKENNISVPEELCDKLQDLKIKKKVLDQQMESNHQRFGSDEKTALMRHSGYTDLTETERDFSRARSNLSVCDVALKTESIGLPSILPQSTTSLGRTRWADPEIQVPVEITSSFPALSPVNLSNSKSLPLPRSVHSLPALIPGNQLHPSPHDDFSNKTVLLSVPRVLTKQKNNEKNDDTTFVDVESTSMSSLSTGKSQTLTKASKPSAQNYKRGIQNQHCAKLKGSKGVIPHDSTKQLKVKNAQKRTSLLPASHQRARLGQSKSVLVPHKVVADGKKLQHGTSPYRSLVSLKPKKSVTSQRK